MFELIVSLMLNKEAKKIINFSKKDNQLIRKIFRLAY